MSENNQDNHHNAGGLKERILVVFGEYYKRTTIKKFHHLSVQADDCWNLNISFVSRGGDYLVIRNLGTGDNALLESLKEELGERSREFFCPYPWNDSDKLKKSVDSAIRKSIDRVDASYVVVADGRLVGHFFLWGAGCNSHSLQYGLNVPELGIAVADSCQGKGLGFLAVRILQEIGQFLRSDAIELTTALSNDAGWNMYHKTGFIYTGNIRNPLEVDVTLAVAGKVFAQKYREERQMVYVINLKRKEAIMRYLELKRKI